MPPQPPVPDQDSPRQSVRVRRRFGFSAQRLFDAWLDPACAKRWLFVTPAGTMVRAESDPRVGGAFNFTERRDGVDVAHEGEYLEIVRPERLVFNFRVPLYSAENSRVELEFKTEGSGCALTLMHHGVFANYVQPVTEGWTGILAGLERALT